MSFGKLALRLTLGPLFIGHGTQKLFGWFGGYGLEGTGGFFESIGLRPGKRHATAGGASEAIGGALLVLGGPGVPIATTLITGAMVTAIRKVHLTNGPWVSDSGWEYNAVIIAALAALNDDSVTAAAAVGAGVAGSYVVTEFLTDPAPEEPAAATNGTSPEPAAATA